LNRSVPEKIEDLVIVFVFAKSMYNVVQSFVLFNIPTTINLRGVLS
jgi:hypothetical protein